jgi:hypothetical protein
MSAKLQSKITYANIMATVAVFIALGGASYAATQLPKNSVGSKQLKKNAVVTKSIKKEAVTGAKVKKGSLTGANINLSKLGTVPAATTATTAQALSPHEPIHLVGAPGEPGFEGEASNLGSLSPTVPVQSVGFFKDHEGIVHLVGTAKAGNGGLVFRLPEGFRPANNTLEFFNGNENHPVAVAGTGLGGGIVSGLVIGFTTPKGSPVILGGITFPAQG